MASTGPSSIAPRPSSSTGCSPNSSSCPCRIAPPKSCPGLTAGRITDPRFTRCRSRPTPTGTLTPTGTPGRGACSGSQPRSPPATADRRSSGHMPPAMPSQPPPTAHPVPADYLELLAEHGPGSYAGLAVAAAGQLPILAWIHRVPSGWAVRVAREVRPDLGGCGNHTNVRTGSRRHFSWPHRRPRLVSRIVDSLLFSGRHLVL